MSWSEWCTDQILWSGIDSPNLLEIQKRISVQLAGSLQKQTASTASQSYIFKINRIWTGPFVPKLCHSLFLKLEACRTASRLRATVPCKRAVWTVDISLHRASENMHCFYTICAYQIILNFVGLWSRSLSDSLRLRKAAAESISGSNLWLT